MNFKKILLLLVAFVALILIQKEIVMPFVLDVVSSDAFLTDTEDSFDQNATTTSMTNFANMQCNHYISNEYGEGQQFVFAEKPINSWAMGGYNYLINSELEYTDTEGQRLNQKYVCRIQYKNGKDDEGVADFDNWKVVGISGLDGI